MPKDDDTLVEETLLAAAQGAEDTESTVPSIESVGGRSPTPPPSEVSDGLSDGSPIEPDRSQRVLNQILRLSVVATTLALGTALILEMVSSSALPEESVGLIVAAGLGVLSVSSIVFWTWPRNARWLRVAQDPSGAPSVMGAFRIAVSLLGSPLLGASFHRQSYEEIVRPLIARTSEDRPKASAPPPPPVSSKGSGSSQGGVDQIVKAYGTSQSSVGLQIPGAVVESYDESRTRLLRAVDDLERKSSRNLWFGLVLAIVGLSSIGLAVYDASAVSATSTTEAWLHVMLSLVPKVVLGVIVELTAMFFLRLYRQGLDDFKYYHNELTNIESKWLALCCALELVRHDKLDGSTIAQTIEQLASTERNFILKKGESTVALDHERLRGQVERRVHETLRTFGADVAGGPQYAAMNSIGAKPR